MSGEELKAIRGQLGVTQTQLAMALEIDVSTLSRYERGVLRTLKTVEIAVRALAQDPNLREEYLP